MMAFDVANFKTIRDLQGRHKGQSALIVGGGPSGRAWELLAQKIHPDIVIGVNGTILKLGDKMDYWLCIEAHANKMPWFYAPTRAKRCVMKRLWDDVPDKEDAYLLNRDTTCFSINHPFRIREIPYSDGLKYEWVDPEWAESSFNIREPIMDRDGGISLFQGSHYTDRGQVEGRLRSRDVGTVMTNAIHFAGILGCSDVYTIGLDLYFPDGEPNHWYPERDYDEFADITDVLGYATWDKSMYVRQYGLRTTWWWIEAANLLKLIKPLMERQGLRWHDCSNGLIQRMEAPKMGRRLGSYHDLLGNFEAKPRVLVVGAGPSALHIHRIPFDRYSVISCNSAALLVWADIWLGFDQYCHHFPWFNLHSAKHYIIGGPLCERSEHDYWEMYWDQFLPENKEIPVLTSATVTGMALQVAAMMRGVERIDLTGCDFGNMPFHFYDYDEPPTARPDANMDRMPIERMQMLIEQVRTSGIEINHYGPTCLAVREI
ncbi:MAG: hypothetical protein HRF49_07690 [bacterium]|jgi:hypothetical protein